MDPTQSNDGSQGGFPGGNLPPYQGLAYPFMYGYQPPQPMYTQGMQQLRPYVPMMHPSTNGPQMFHPAENAAAPSTNGPQMFHPAENAAAPVETDELRVLEQPPPVATGKGKRTKGGSRIKLANFSPEEDVNLVTSYLEISEDAITNTGQKRDRFWERVQQRYNLRRGSYPERTCKSLQCRWELMKPEVMKFGAYHVDAVQTNPSGVSDADKTSLAAANFAEIEEHKFGYMHCWHLLKDSPSWQDPKHISAADTNLGDELASPSASSGKRPMGRDACKAAKKKSNSSTGSASSSEYASRMQDLSLQRIAIMQEDSAKKNDRFQQLAAIDEKRFEEMRSHNQSLLQCEQEKIRIMREKHDMERQEKEKQDDERILGIDLETCTPPLRVYYEYRQRAILAKIAGSHMNGQGPEE